MRQRIIKNWEDEYSLGIKRIDEEHLFLFKLIQFINKQYENDNSFDDILMTLDEFEKYTIFHFLSEENLMKRINYSGFVKHTEKHYELFEEFNFHKHNSKNDLKGMIEFLWNWFENHILTEDRKFSNWIIKNHIDIEQYNLDF